ncbi:MAG: TonB family protein [Candidatus Acidiferrales bacterium]
MTFLEELVATPLARAVGWTLLHSVWEGAAASLVLAAVLAATRSARARYAAACVAMLATVVATVLTFVRLMPGAMYGAGAAVNVSLVPWDLQASLHPDASNSALAAIVPWLAPVWIIGVWIFVLAQFASWFSTSRLRHRGVCAASERWQAEVARLRTMLRISRPVRLLESCLADVPVVIGQMRPVILMPVGLLSGLPVAQIEAILLHELAHIRRCDYLVNVVQRSVESLFFYNPAVWWISSVIRSERENCCDDIVVATSGNAREYVRALTALEESRWPGREAALAASGGNLMKRIRRLLDPKLATAVWTPALAAIIVVMTAAVTLAAWPPAVLHRAVTLAQNEQKSAAQSKYEKWLNEDVTYIITPQERAAFARLKTDAERDKFIDQFWEHRNPHPGSAVNAYKEHYYRSTAYANQHFSFDGNPGWRTDRGHVLIVYGPPDEIDSHKTPYAYEEWRYKQIDEKSDNVTFKFVDRSGHGDYKLISSPASQSKKESGQSNVPKAGTNGYSHPTCVYCPQPQYTEAALKTKYQGTVELLAVIDAEGHPVHIQVVKGSGVAARLGLYQKALEAVRKWRFRPATGPDGKPAMVQQNIDIGFHLY